MATILRNTRIDHILYSVDYPFAKNEDGLEFMRDLQKSGLVSEEQLEMIAYRNAESLFGVHLGEPEGGEIGQFVREAGDVFELFRVLRGDGRGGGCGVGEEVFLQGYERRDHGRRLSHPVGRFETGRDGKTKEMDQAKDDQTNKNLGGAGESSDVC